MIPNQNQTNDYHVRLGRWGEEYINFKLTEQKQRGEIASFKWLNENGDIRSSHDFELKENIESELLYIDVKATEGNKADPVYITEQEWRKIFKARQNYLIYRVYHVDLESSPASNSTAMYSTFKPFQNLIDWMQEKIIQSCRMSSNKSTKIHGTGKLLE